jgi:hypothetical protein
MVNHGSKTMRHLLKKMLVVSSMATVSNSLPGAGKLIALMFALNLFSR